MGTVPPKSSRRVDEEVEQNDADLLRGEHQTDHRGKQCNTFDEGSKDQSSALDRALGFRLTGNALTGRSADPTDTHACAYGSKSCGKSCTDTCAVISGFGKGVGGCSGGFGILEEIKHWGFSVLN
jgi:hypothetical protein